jgi:hypothetical protein
VPFLFKIETAVTPANRGIAIYPADGSYPPRPLRASTIASQKRLQITQTKEENTP